MSSANNAEAELRAVDDLANVWTRRGIALLDENTPTSLKTAIDCFGKAIEIRNALPLENDGFRYGLAAGWLNRGDALTRLGSSEQLAEALRSFDEAIAHLEQVPLNANPLFRKRMAIAWLNRGLALQAQRLESQLTRAVAAFDRSVSTLNEGNASEISDRSSILACAWMNRGNTLLSFTKPAPLLARTAARESLQHSAQIEKSDRIAADVGLRARHVLCRAIAVLLSDSTCSTNSGELICEATDAVEEGLRLAAGWEQRGETKLHALTGELFHFGARVYQAYQPHFLSEFLVEYPPSGDQNNRAEMRAAAQDTLQRLLAEIQHASFKSLNSPAFDCWLERLKELREAQEHLI